MAVRPHLDRLARLLIIAGAHDDWVDQWLTDETPFTPRKGKSDYNQHFLDVEATPTQDADLWARVQPALTAHLPGKHDQSTHGRGAGYELGRDVSDDDLDEMSEFWPEHLQLQYGIKQNWKNRQLRETMDDPVARRGLDAAHDDFKASVDGPISVQVTPSAVSGILREQRFKTQHEIRPKTQASGYKPDVRRAYEENFMGVPHDTALEHKPVYGYVGDSSVAKRYGSVRFELHDAVKDRTTVTYGDSLNGLAIPLRIQDVKSAPAYRRRRAMNPSDVESHISNARVGRSGMKDYVEAQVHGGIRITDVRRVHAPKEVADKYRRRLEKYNIEVVET